MASKKSNQGNSSSGGGLPALRIGSRVRCTDDGVEGRITWANGVSVKIQWDDGEQITWRRDSLTDRPIEILDPDGDEQPDAMMATPAEVEQTALTDSPRTEVEMVPPAPEAVPTEPTAADAEPTTTGEAPLVPEPAQEQTALALADGAAKIPAKSKRRRKEPVTPKKKKLSALDAAAKVLAEAGQAMTCQEMIATMVAKGYWTSPNGRTPAGTLYSAILRETTTKGTANRFVKAERGKFALTNAQEGV